MCEQLGYNMLFRWFVGLSLDKTPWDHSTYTKNRDRFIDHEVVRELSDHAIVTQRGNQWTKDTKAR